MPGRKGTDGALGAACGIAVGGAALAPLILAREVPARLDLVDFFWPMKAYTAARWAEGSAPLWNPLSACGEPWLAQLQTGALYPPDLLFLLAWPLGAWLALLFHFAVAGAGMSSWLRDLGLSRRAALAGAGLYAGSGTFLSLVPVLNNAWTAAWLPWVFLAARRAATGGCGAGLALASALAFLAGEPLLASAGTLAALVLALVSRREDLPLARGAWKAWGAGLLLGAGIACAAAWPFAEHLRSTGRFANVSREEALARPLGTGDLGDLVAPARLEETHAPSTRRSGYLVSLAGAPLLFLLAAGSGAGIPGRRRLLAGLALLGVGALLLALGARGGLAPLLYDSGVLRGARFPARWFVFAHLALSALAAAGWDGWVHGRAPGDDPEGRRERRAALLSAALAALALSGAALCALVTAGSRDFAGSALVGAATLAGGLLLVRLRRSGPSPALERGLLAALLVPLPFLARAPLEGTPAGPLGEPPPLAAKLPPGRVFTAGADPSLLAAFSRPQGRWDASSPLRARALLAGYANLPFGIPSATSASPIRDGRTTRILGAALDGGDPAALFALADVRTLLTPFRTRIPGARLVGARDEVLRYELPAGAGRLFFPREARVAEDDEVFEALRRKAFVYDDIAWVAPTDYPLPPRRGRGWAVGTVLTEKPERVEISASCSEPSLLVVTRSWDAGWTASVDGLATPLLRADLAFLGIALPAGEHRVTLEYAPRSWRLGRWVSLASLALAAALFLAAPRRSIG